MGTKRSPRQDLSAFLEVMANFSPEVGVVAMRARTLIVDLLPEVFEVVWVPQKTIGYGTGPKKLTEHFAWIAPAKRHVTLGFNQGTELPDPSQLLEGTGKRFRHVKLTSMADVERPAVVKLVRAAIRHRGAV